MGATLVAPMLVFGQVQLTEVMSNPEGSDGDREWVEAINVGSAVTITTGRSGWRLSDGSNHLLKGESFTWQSNEVVLFAQDLGKFRAEHPGISNRLIESSFSLKNSEGAVKLANEQDVLLATANYGEGEEGYSFINSGGNWVRGQKNGAPGTYPDTAAPINSLSPAQPNVQPATPAPAPPATPSSAAPASASLPPAQLKPSVVAAPAAVPPTVTPASQPENLPAILISEFLPNTEGRDDSEFIELALTPSSSEVKLDEMIVRVGEKKVKLAGVASGAFIVLSKKDHHFSIRNKGETVTLFWKDQPIHKISYSGAAPAGRSFARLASGDWVWTEPTPGATNVLVEAAKIEKSSDKNTIEELPLTAQVNGQAAKGSKLPSLAQANITPLLIGFASALLLSLAAVVFLK